MPDSLRVAGVDIWKGKWVAVILNSGRFEGVAHHKALKDLVADLGDVEVIGIDIPIGCPKGKKPRLADLEAKKFIGPKLAAAVFLTPPMIVIKQPSYAEANKLSKERFGRGISRQAYALRRYIFEADELVKKDKRLREVHPEVSFAALRGEPLPYRKKSWNGQNLRRALLESTGIIIPPELEAAPDTPADDILDAAVAAWSANRIARGERDCLGDPSKEPGVIWY